MCSEQARKYPHSPHNTAKNEAILIPLINSSGELEAIQVSSAGIGYTYASLVVAGVQELLRRLHGREAGQTLFAFFPSRVAPKINHAAIPMTAERFLTLGGTHTNAQIEQALAADIPRLGRLPAPEASASKHSKLCGSTVTVDLVTDGGTVTDFAHDVKACALGQASSSIMASHVVGSKADELRKLRDTVRKMLKENGEPPQDGKWADIAVLDKAAFARFVETAKASLGAAA